jgi:hypothetical protein
MYIRLIREINKGEEFTFILDLMALKKAGGLDFFW